MSEGEGEKSKQKVYSYEGDNFDNERMIISSSMFVKIEKIMIVHDECCLLRKEITNDD